jgi:hypothetical protein
MPAAEVRQPPPGLRREADRDRRGNRRNEAERAHCEPDGAFNDHVGAIASTTTRSQWMFWRCTGRRVLP